MNERASNPTSASIPGAPRAVETALLARWRTPGLLCALLAVGACDDGGVAETGGAGTTTMGSNDGGDTDPSSDPSAGQSNGGDQDGGSSGGGGDTTGGDDNSTASAGDDSTSTGASGLPPGVFLADDEDYIIFDIESVAGHSPPDPWVFADSGPCGNQADCEYLGEGYYQFKGANECGQTQDHDMGVMEIEFEVKTAGRYRLAWRNLRDHTGGCGDDRNNDSFVAFPTTLSEEHFQEPFKVFGGGHDTYNWTNSYDIHDVGKERVCVEFEPGVHTLRLSGRSNNHAIDRVAIFRVEGDLEECRKNSYLNDLDDRPVTGQSP